LNRGYYNLGDSVRQGIFSQILQNRGAFSQILQNRGAGIGQAIK
jgi:hypothetical protein